MRIIKLLIALCLCSCAYAQSVPYPQIPLTGTIGSGGIFPLLNSGNLVFSSDANHTMVYPETTAQGFLKVTSSVSLTATRNLIAPLNLGFSFVVENATTGGQAIQVIGPSGTGITIPNGALVQVYSDGTNYLQSAFNLQAALAASPYNISHTTEPNAICTASPTTDGVFGCNNPSLTPSTICAWNNGICQSVSALSFGAVGDWNGTTGTDNTAAINAALAYEIAHPGTCVYFPSGGYAHLSQITWNSTSPVYLCLRGEDARATYLIYTGSGTVTAGFYAGIPTGTVFIRMDVRDIAFSSNANAGYAFYTIRVGTSSIMDNVYFSGGSISAFEADFWNGQSDLRDLLAGPYGVPGSSTCVNGLTFSNGLDGGSTFPSSQFTLTMPVVKGCSGIGLNMPQAAAITVNGGQFSNNYQNMVVGCNTNGCNGVGNVFNNVLDEAPTVTSTVAGARNHFEGLNGNLNISGISNEITLSEGLFAIQAGAVGTIMTNDEISDGSTDAGTGTIGWNNVDVAQTPWTTTFNAQPPTNIQTLVNSHSGASATLTIPSGQADATYITWPDASGTPCLLTTCVALNPTGSQTITNPTGDALNIVTSGSASSALNVTNNFAETGNIGVTMAQFLAPNIAAGQSTGTGIVVGTAPTALNYTYIAFQYAGTGSTSNAAYFGVGAPASPGDPLGICTTGGGIIGLGYSFSNTVIPPACPTTGATVQFGGNATSAYDIQAATMHSGGSGSTNLVCTPGNGLCPTGITNPMTTLGDTIYGGASGAATRLAGPTTTAHVFAYSDTPVGSASVAPAWYDLTLNVPTFVGNNAYTGTSTYIGAAATTPVLVENVTAATSGANRNSPCFGLSGQYWTGSATAGDTFTQCVQYGTGANPTKILVFSDATGSSGAAAVQFPQVQSNGFVGETAQSTGNITFGAGAGGTPTGVTIVGTDVNFQISFTTTGVPTPGALVFTVAYTQNRGHVPYCTYAAASIPATGVLVDVDAGSALATSTSVFASAAGLATSSAYTFNMFCP